jgi:RimJ/RimL family protein N-acetyltransferase
VTEILVSPRLTLRPWAESDVPLLATLASTPAVVRYIGDGQPWSQARVHAAAAVNAEHWRRHGFGWRVASMADDGTPIGFIALNCAGDGGGIDPGEYEIGWWLAPQAWGRGLAREGAAAVRDEAFERVGVPSVVARIQPPNVASLAVATAIGLTPESETTGRFGERAAVLRLSAAEWRARHRSARPDAPA